MNNFICTLNWYGKLYNSISFYSIFVDLTTNDRVNKTNYVLDHFQTTVPLSTYAFGFIISQLTRVHSPESTLSKPKINVWARKDLHGDLTVHFFFRIKSQK